jgi:hypothetical protein
VRAPAKASWDNPCYVTRIRDGRGSMVEDYLRVYEALLISASSSPSGA